MKSFLFLAFLAFNKFASGLPPDPGDSFATPMAPVGLLTFHCGPSFPPEPWIPDSQNLIWSCGPGETYVGAVTWETDVSWHPLAFAWSDPDTFNSLMSLQYLASNGYPVYTFRSLESELWAAFQARMIREYKAIDMASLVDGASLTPALDNSGLSRTRDPPGPNGSGNRTFGPLFRCPRPFGPLKASLT